MEFSPKRFILGCATLGTLYRKEVSVELAAAVIQAAFDVGIRKLDTARLYGYGLSEVMIGKALRHLNIDSNSVDIATKAGRIVKFHTGQVDSTQPNFWALPKPYCDYVEDWGLGWNDGHMCFVQSCEAVGSSRFADVSLHDCDDAMAELAARGMPVDYGTFDGVIKALKELQAAGRIGQIGFANKQSQAIIELTKLHPGVFQYAMTTNYTLAMHEEAGQILLPFCQANGLQYRVAGPFCSRVLARDPRAASSVECRDGKQRICYGGDVDDPVTFNYHDITETQHRRVCEIWDICERHGENSPRAASIQFCLANPAVDQIVIGATKPERFAELVADVEREIPELVWDDLRKSGHIAACAPVPGDLVAA